MYECACGHDVEIENGVVHQLDGDNWLCCPDCGSKIINLVGCSNCGDLVVDDGCSYAHISIFGHPMKHLIVCEECQESARKAIALAAADLSEPLFEYLKHSCGLSSIIYEFEDDVQERRFENEWQTK